MRLFRFSWTASCQDDRIFSARYRMLTVYLQWPLRLKLWRSEIEGEESKP